MPRFNVRVYDRRVAVFDKVFTAASEADARMLAEDEGVHDEGWQEQYDELFSEQYIESVQELFDEEDD